MIEQRTKGSHFLPRTYLKHFLYNDRLVVYKKGEKFFKDNIKQEDRILEVIGVEGLKNIAKENNLYRVKTKDGNFNTIENLFGELAENDFDKIIQIVKEKKIGDKIDRELKEKLCLFMATMRVRTPQFKGEVEEIAEMFLKMRLKGDVVNISTEEKAKIKLDYKRETGKILTDDKIDKTILGIAQGKADDLKMQFPNEFFVTTALRSLIRYTEIFLNMRMNILKAEEDRYFITSDNPFIYFVPEDKVTFYSPPKSLVSLSFPPLSRQFFTEIKIDF